jgi:arginine N-succinyltransferase
MGLKRGHRRRGDAAELERASPDPHLHERILVREARPRDVEALFELSSFLDSVNIPHDRALLSRLVRKAKDSFSGRIDDPAKRTYVFVLELVPSKRIVGTCTIYAQHGHPEAPYVFFDVVDDERYSSTLNRHFSHQTLRLGFNYQGPTEIGALVLHPDFRAAGLGRALSFCRFLFIAMYRERFRPEVIAELMPPLESDGRSLLWEHLGRHFTGLSYQEADKLTHHDKEFIYALFPQSPLYASLLPPDVRALIGEVGPETVGVRRMLEDVGFEYRNRIDPFDGGPHFVARVGDVRPIREARRLRVSRRQILGEHEELVLDRQVVGGVERRLIGVSSPDGPTRFRATLAGVTVEGGNVLLTKATRKLLGVEAREDVWVTTL